MRSVIAWVRNGASSAALVAVVAASGPGCKKSSDEVAKVDPAPSATAVAEASLEEAKADSGDADEKPEGPGRKLTTGRRAKGAEPEAGTGNSEATDAVEAEPSHRPVPRGRPAAATPLGRPAPRALPGRPAAGPAPEAEAGGIAADPSAAPDMAVEPLRVAPVDPSVVEAVQPEGAVLPEGAALEPAGGMPRGPRPGVLPNSRPSGPRPPAAAPPALPGDVPGEPVVEPPVAPAFDEGLDSPTGRVDRVRGRPHGRPVPAAPPGDVPGAEPVIPGEAGYPAEVEPPMGGPGHAVGRPGADVRARIALPTQVKPNAELLLRKEDMVTLLLLTRPIDVHDLPGLIDEPGYDAIFWGSPDGSDYYAGLQVWKPRSPIEAQRRYTQMVRSYPNAEETTAVGTNAFLGFWNDFYYLVFRTNDNANPTVAALTCSREACSTPDKLVTLARQIFDRLKAKELVP